MTYPHPLEQLEQRLAEHNSAVTIAAVNTATSLVLSGPAQEIASWISRLTAEGVFCRQIEVDYASHSAQMDVVVGRLSKLLTGLEPRSGRCTMISTVTGEPIDGEAAHDPHVAWPEKVVELVKAISRPNVKTPAAICATRDVSEAARYSRL